MTQTKKNYAKKGNRISVKVMFVNTKELSEKAPKAKKNDNEIKNNVKRNAK